MSTTQTALVLAQATNSRLASFENTIALGCSPTAISPRLSSVAASNTSTFAPPQTETNTVFPSGDTTHVYGSAPTSTVRRTSPDFRSTIVRASPSTCTA